ncbi:acyl carrier protein [Mycolicibacterium sp. NCC-Tsukiji]|uniref:acyl carrier protein n=1 Tax=Mycolicibacterium sp. NCC-Tsukiji TaxID=2185272 RepID=UPI00278BD09F|nr:acyl carrier protein [Mycolicibacterium sp. NCC-Tsukiji]
MRGGHLRTGAGAGFRRRRKPGRWYQSRTLPNVEGKPSLNASCRLRSLDMESTTESVSAGLAKIMQDDMGVDIRRVTRESRLINDVGLDSVAFAVGMVAIEDRFGVALSEEDLLSSETVGDLEDAITAKLPTAQRS